MKYKERLVARGSAYWSDRKPSENFEGDIGALYSVLRSTRWPALYPSTVDIELVAIDREFSPPFGNETSRWGGDGWTVRLVGDPMVAVRDVDCKKYWKGEVEIPLHVTPGVEK